MQGRIDRSTAVSREQFPDALRARYQAVDHLESIRHTCAPIAQGGQGNVRVLAAVRITISL